MANDGADTYLGVVLVGTKLLCAGMAVGPMVREEREVQAPIAQLRHDAPRLGLLPQAQVG